MMSNMNAGPPQSETDRTVAIDFLFLDLSTCRRCLGTAAQIESALAAVDGALQATGARVALRKIHVRSAEQARELQFVSSPTIRINDRDIAPEVLESACGTAACSCGPNASCRMWAYRGRMHDEAPVGLIVDAILTELYAATTRPDPAQPAYELPDNLMTVLAPDDEPTTAGGCCS